jgi:copper chaperone CopZ
MKTIKFCILAILAFTITTVSFAQGALKTESLKVGGNCETCEVRIEKAAKIPGVTKADWSTKTKVLTVTYDPKKATSDVIQKNIAAAGHDTPKYKASDNVYNALPACCKYRK